MRVPHVQLILAAAAIAHAMKAKTTTSVAAENTTHFSTESSSTAGGDNGDGVMNSNVLVEEVLAKAKTITPAESATTSSTESSSTASGNDGERGGIHDFLKSVFNIDENMLAKPIAELSKKIFPEDSVQSSELEKILRRAANRPKNSASAIVSLKKHLDDKRVVELIEAAKDVEETKSFAGKLEEALFQEWLSENPIPRDLLARLGLDKAHEDLLASPLYRYVTTYVERFNAKYFLQKTNVASFLTPSYGDIGLSTIIQKAKKVEKSKFNALELEEEQLNNWLDSELSAEHLFTRLELDKVTDSLLNHLLFSQWFSYFERAKKHFGDETSLADFLTEKVALNRITFEQLLEEQVAKTKIKSRSRGDELFLELRLNRVNDGLFTHPLFKYWRDCMDNFDKERRKKPRTSVVESLTAVFGGKGLKSLIEAELKVTDSAEYARSLQKSQLIGWANDGSSLGDVFGYLGLDEADYKMLKQGNPLMDRFIEFANMYVSNNADLTEKMLSNMLEGKEKWVNQGIYLASGMGGLPTTKMEQTFFRMWFTQEKNPNEIIAKHFRKVIREDESDALLKENLFKIPLFVTFLKYADAFPRTTFARRPALPEELKEIKPEKKRYSLDPETGENFVEIKVDVVNMISLRFSGNLDKLGKMILSAKNPEESTKSAQYAAQRVEDDLFRHWSNNPNIGPDDVWSWLELPTPKLYDAEMMAAELDDAEMTAAKLDEETTFATLDENPTPPKLYDEPLFHWWIDYMDVYLKLPDADVTSRFFLTKVFESKENVLWLKEAQKENKFAKKVWTELVNQHIVNDTPPRSNGEGEHKIEGFDEVLYLSEDSPEDMHILKSYTEAYYFRKERLEFNHFWQEKVRMEIPANELKAKELEAKKRQPKSGNVN